jgi:hypothetical protein
MYLVVEKHKIIVKYCQFVFVKYCIQRHIHIKIYLVHFNTSYSFKVHYLRVNSARTKRGSRVRIPYDTVLFSNLKKNVHYIF